VLYIQTCQIFAPCLDVIIECIGFASICKFDCSQGIVHSDCKMQRDALPEYVVEPG
jgi:hypothetical protein